MAYKVRSIREEKGLTQEELAQKSGVSRGTIIALESGTARETTTKTLAKLAHALGVSVESIFFEKSV